METDADNVTEPKRDKKKHQKRKLEVRPPIAEQSAGLPAPLSAPRGIYAGGGQQVHHSRLQGQHEKRSLQTEEALKMQQKDWWVNRLKADKSWVYLVQRVTGYTFNLLLPSNQACDWTQHWSQHLSTPCRSQSLKNDIENDFRHSWVLIRFVSSSEECRELQEKGNLVPLR